MYAMEFIYREPARKTEEGRNGVLSDERCHGIAVESREAERMRKFVGDLKARTYNASDLRGDRR
jgi:hypothetical protein